MNPKPDPELDPNMKGITLFVSLQGRKKYWMFGSGSEQINKQLSQFGGLPESASSIQDQSF